MSRDPLSQLVSRIRTEQALTNEVPDFDPANGNGQGKFLFLLEAPGPGAIKTGLVSFDNPDPSARNLKDQLEEAGIDRKEIALWNVVPWYIGNPERTAIRAARRQDIRAGFIYLKPLIDAMPNLKCVVLVGTAARIAHIYLSSITTARILACHHTSARAQNSNTQAAAENIAVFRMLRA